jgi:hypothetical protein
MRISGVALIAAGVCLLFKGGGENLQNVCMLGGMTALWAGVFLLALRRERAEGRL